MPNNTANEIRRSFRSRMNGVVSQNMRSYGSEYRINWGVSLLHLKEMAAEYEPDSEVARILWHDDVRESRIMALLLMPADGFDPETAREWIADLRSVSCTRCHARRQSTDTHLCIQPHGKTCNERIQTRRKTARRCHRMYRRRNAR